MKAIILVAGYATRLYPLTLTFPKALLPINNKPILDYIYNEIETIPEIDEVFIVTNAKFYTHFKEWQNTRFTSKRIKVINDHSTSDNDKLGAIGDLHLVIHKEKIQDDILVIAGDNFFTYKLSDFMNFYKAVQADCVCVQQQNNKDDLKRMGVAILDHNSRIINLEEKPANPKSSIAVFATYMYKKETVPLFNTYLEEGNIPDAPGHFIEWLYKRKCVYGYPFHGECYDIGTHDSYRDVREKFESMRLEDSEVASASV